jgi:hypothetical protein
MINGAPGEAIDRAGITNGQASPLDRVAHLDRHVSFLEHRMGAVETTLAELVEKVKELANAIARRAAS